MIESVAAVPDKTSELAGLARGVREIKESEKNENIADTAGVTFKSVISLVFFIFFCAILAAALSDNVANIIGENGVAVAHYLGSHSDKLMMVLR